MRIVNAFLAVLAIWVLISFADIVADNKKPNPTHSEYNFFCVVFPAE